VRPSDSSEKEGKFLVGEKGKEELIVTPMYLEFTSAAFSAFFSGSLGTYQNNH